MEGVILLEKFNGSPDWFYVIVAAIMIVLSIFVVVDSVIDLKKHKYRLGNSIVVLIAIFLVMLPSVFAIDNEMNRMKDKYCKVAITKEKFHIDLDKYTIIRNEGKIITLKEK